MIAAQALTIALLATMFHPTPVQRARVSITIEAPRQNERVRVHQDVSGKVSDRSVRVWVVVQPRETADCWVQNPIVVNSDGRWRVSAQFGEERPDHKGKAYEIRALADPKGRVGVGKTSCWPEAEVISDPVYVVRE